MIDWNGVTVVFLFYYQKYLQCFYTGYKFPHLATGSTTSVCTGRKTNIFVTKPGQAMTEQP